MQEWIQDCHFPDLLFVYYPRGHQCLYVWQECQRQHFGQCWRWVQLGYQLPLGVVRDQVSLFDCACMSYSFCLLQRQRRRSNNNWRAGQEIDFIRLGAKDEGVNTINTRSLELKGAKRLLRSVQWELARGQSFDGNGKAHGHQNGNIEHKWGKC